MEAISSTLSFMGALLFLLGLLTGFGIPKFRSPRIGLSAHLDAIESGLGLIAFGLLLLHLRISVGWASLIGHTMWISLYLLWLGLVVGAVFGTGKSITNRRRRPGCKAMARECRRDVDFSRLDWLRPRDRDSPRPMALERLKLFDSPRRPAMTQQMESRCRICRRT